MAIIALDSTGPPTTLSEVINTAHAHDEIHIKGVVEVSDSITIRVPLVFVGHNGQATIVSRMPLRQGRGIFITECDTTIKNIGFKGAKCLSGNGAGVWHESGKLVLDDCLFAKNQNGVMVADNSCSEVSINRCSFFGNGAGCGHTHGLYVNKIKCAAIYECTFIDTHVGHHIKSRAAKTHIGHSYFSGSPQCTASYSIDIPFGGIAIIEHNRLIKSRDSMSRKFISYCSEGRAYPESRIAVRSNIFTNHRSGPSVAVANYSLGVRALARDNIYERVTFAILGRRDRSNPSTSRSGDSSPPSAAASP